MLIKSNEGDILEVTSYKKSPLLVVMEETDIPVDEEDGAIILDFSTYGLQEYIKFLEGEEVDVTLEVKDIIDYMCHDNKLGYPDEFWQLKKKHGLVRVPIKNEDNIRVYMYTNRYRGNSYDLIIRGGDIALYMGGYIDTYNEVDIFPLEHEDSARIVSGYIDALSTRKIKYRVHNDVHSSTEAAHRYDIPCLGIVYDGSNLWSTELALWCNKNKTIWVEPDKMSIPYIGQLYKYMKKGYSIKVPYIGMVDVDEGKAKDILVAMTMASRFDNSLWSTMGPIEDPMKIPRPISKIRTYNELGDNERLVDECMRRMNRRRIRLNEQMKEGIPIVYDLPVRRGYIEYIPYENDVSVNFMLLIFYGICINPGSKDTSREVIDDFLEWMKSSPIAK